MGSKIIIVMTVLFFAVSSSLTGCGRSDTETIKGEISSITVIDGNSQSATVGTELPNPLTALVKNIDGQPLAGKSVNFKVVLGGGSVSGEGVKSDASGYVRERWRLGTAAGPQRVELTAVDSTGAEIVFATFSATATAGSPGSISISSGDGQSAVQVQQLPLPVAVVVKDIFGNPVPGTTVSFVPSHGGSVTPGSAVTDGDGLASAFWTLGISVGIQTLSATVAGILPISFEATATQAPATAPTRISIFSGDSQTVVRHSLMNGVQPPGEPIVPVGEPLTVLVTDNMGNPVPDVLVTFSSSSGSGYITPTNVRTNSSGQARWGGYLHISGLQKIDASLTGLPNVTFSINVTETNHTYDGRYNCNARPLLVATTPPSIFNSFNMTILNGLIWPRPCYVICLQSGAVNESDGNFTTFVVLERMRGAEVSGQLTVDSFQQGGGAGTYKEELASLTLNTGTWVCSRE